MLDGIPSISMNLVAASTVTTPSTTCESAMSSILISRYILHGRRDLYRKSKKKRINQRGDHSSTLRLTSQGTLRLGPSRTHAVQWILRLSMKGIPGLIPTNCDGDGLGEVGGEQDSTRNTSIRADNVAGADVSQREWPDSFDRYFRIRPERGTERIYKDSGSTYCCSPPYSL